MPEPIRQVADEVGSSSLLPFPDLFAQRVAEINADADESLLNVKHSFATASGFVFPADVEMMADEAADQ